MQLKPGLPVDRFELVAFIGCGGMAEVWSAREPRTGRMFALKTLLEEYCSDANLQERLRREAESQTRLQHPCIVRAYGTFQWYGRTFIRMDYIDGGSLAHHLERRRVLSLAEVSAVTRALLSGLGHAHRNGIIHRDVKPSNILLSTQGGIYISDLGIALCLGQTRLTRYGTMGTPAYMSPEQIRAPLQIDHRSDIYSTGCVLYELLTGYAPFHFASGNNDFLTRQAHLHAAPDSPARHNPEVTPAFERAILRALEKSPAARFQDCAEFAQALGVEIEIGAVRTNQPRIVVAPGLRPGQGAQPATPAPAARPRVVRGPGVASPPLPVTPPRVKIRKTPWPWIIAGAAVLLLLFAVALLRAHAAVNLAPDAPGVEGAGRATPARVPGSEPLPAAPPRRPHPALPDPAGQIPGGETAGVLEWEGRARPGQSIAIEGAEASTGAVSGDVLPGVPVDVPTAGGGVRIAEPPAGADGFRRMVLRTTADQGGPR